MKRFLLCGLMGCLLVFCFLTPGHAVGDDKTIQIERTLQGMVNDPGQTQVLVVPAEPLEFETTIQWDVTIGKVSLAAEKAAPSVIITDASGKQLERRSVSASGTIRVPRETQYKVTINAGEYSRLVAKVGAEVKVNLKYTEVSIHYELGDKPYLVSFKAEGLAKSGNWEWQWDRNDRSTGRQVSHQFSSSGPSSVVIVAGQHKYACTVDLPPLIILQPTIGPLQGPVEHRLAVKMTATVNYGQKATYTWDFGNGISLSGTEAENNYTMPGKYLLILTAKVGDYTFYRNWLVDVAPLAIKPNAVVTPLTGTVPLEVTGSLNPVITGGPTRIKYSWTIAGTPVDAETFKQTFTEPGEYLIRLKTVDELHPDQSIPEQVFVVTAQPPLLTLKPAASIAKGIIPLTVSFTANTEVKGSPVDLQYFWDFGDGEYDLKANPTHVYRKPGNYQAQLVVTDRAHPGNLALATIPIEILVPEMKAAVTSNAANGVVPFTVHFNGQVAITGSPCEPQFTWNFGDGSTSLEQNPTHTYRQEGKFAVSVVVRDRLHPGNETTAGLQLEARMPKLRLTAAVTPTSGSAPLTVQCRAWGEKEGVTDPHLKISWDFGDGTKGDGTDPAHTFTRPGTYTVVVVVTDETLGLTEKKTFKVTVK